MVAVVSSSRSSSSYAPCGAFGAVGAGGVDPADSFEAALAADETAAGEVGRPPVSSSTVAMADRARDSSVVAVRRSDGATAYQIDPSRVHRLAPPTRAGVATLAADLGAEIGAAFAAAGVPADPAVTLSVDDAGIHVSGDRDDLDAIADLLAGDSELRRSIRIAHSIAAQAYALEHTEPEDSYRTAGSPLDVIERFTRMMEAQRAVAMGFVCGGGAVAVTANGTAWPPATDRAA